MPVAVWQAGGIHSLDSRSVLAKNKTLAKMLLCQLGRQVMCPLSPQLWGKGTDDRIAVGTGYCSLHFGNSRSKEISSGKNWPVCKSLGKRDFLELKWEDIRLKIALNNKCIIKLHM